MVTNGGFPTTPDISEQYIPAPLPSPPDRSLRGPIAGGVYNPWAGFPRNLARKLHKIYAGSGYIKKDKRNTAQSYNYISEEAMVRRLRELFIENGVIMIPSVIDTKMIQTEVSTKAGIKAVPITRVTINYTVVDVDTGECYNFLMVGDGTDTGDKAIYKAVTGANKYALMKLCQIPTGDDPEEDWPADTTAEPEPEKPKVDDRTANFISAVNKITSSLGEEKEREVMNRVLGGMGFTSLSEVVSSTDRRKFVDELRQQVNTGA